MVLQPHYYGRNTVDVARDLLGKFLCVVYEGNVLAGMICETEAYCGFDDDACHGHKGKTPRCEVMYGPVGYAYVYFTYGMHYMLNLVTEKRNFPSAVLIRGIVPAAGLEIMSKNRYGVAYSDLSKVQLKNFTNGPGKLTKALNIKKDIHNGICLQSNKIWVEDRGVEVMKTSVLTTPRIGIDYAQNAKDWPWRFVLKG